MELKALLKKLKESATKRIDFCEQKLTLANEVIKSLDQKQKSKTADIIFTSKTISKIYSEISGDSHMDYFHSCPLVYFDFNIDDFAKKLTNGKFVKKTIYTNIITEGDERIWLPPYYDDFDLVKHYYPTTIDIYCNKNFDTSKKYSKAELLELANNKKIIFATDVLEKDRKNITSINDYKKSKSLNKIHYNKKDNAKIVSEKEYKKLQINSNNSLNFLNCHNKLYNADFNKAKIETLDKTYPNFLTTLKEQLICDLNNYKQQKTEQIKAIKNKFVKDCKFIIEKMTEQIQQNQKDIKDTKKLVVDYKGDLEL